MLSKRSDEKAKERPSNLSLTKFTSAWKYMNEKGESRRKLGGWERESEKRKIEERNFKKRNKIEENIKGKR